MRWLRVAPFGPQRRGTGATREPPEIEWRLTQMGSHDDARKKSMRILILMLAFLTTATVGSAQDSLHVIAVHKATRDNEKTYHTGFNQNIITGTIGDRRYTFEQLASWGFYHFEVGSDYPVVKATDKAVKVRVTDKKGRESTESLNVVTVEEIAD
jgi:hypothetical protein